MNYIRTPTSDWFAADLWQHFRQVTIAELSERNVVIAVRKTCFALTKFHALMPGDWLNFLIDGYDRLDVTIVDRRGHPVWQNTEVFDPTDAQIDADEWSDFVRRRYEFFEYNCCQAPSERGGVVDEDWTRQFAVMASIVGAMDLKASRRWPRKTVLRPIWDIPAAANDNRPSRNSRRG